MYKTEITLMNFCSQRNSSWQTFVTTVWQHRTLVSSWPYFIRRMASIAARRLGKELKEIQKEGCPVGMCFVLNLYLLITVDVFWMNRYPPYQGRRFQGMVVHYRSYGRISVSGMSSNSATRDHLRCEGIIRVKNTLFNFGLMHNTRYLHQLFSL